MKDKDQVDLVALIGEDLVAKDIDQMTLTSTRRRLQDKYVGFYFSAHWCPPCRKFTPMLRKFYLRMMAMGRPFEVVYVSSDNSEAEFKEYFLKNMPWTAVPYEQRRTREQLARRFEVVGIPSLVIVSPDGEIMNRNARHMVIKDPEAKLFPWQGMEEGMWGTAAIAIAIMVVIALFAHFVMGW